jgi:hypothetical protein
MATSALRAEPINGSGAVGADQFNVRRTQFVTNPNILFGLIACLVVATLSISKFGTKVLSATLGAIFIVIGLGGAFGRGLPTQWQAGPRLGGALALVGGVAFLLAGAYLLFQSFIAREDSTR